MYDDISFDIGGKKKDKLLSRIAALEAERDRLLARIEDTDSACADYAFAGAHTAREIIEKLHDRIRGYKTDRDLLAEANDQLRAELAECRRDAERYRWLREKIENDDFLIARVSDWGFTSWSGDDPDRYIDAVLAAEG